MNAARINPATNSGAEEPKQMGVASGLVLAMFVLRRKAHTPSLSPIWIPPCT